MAMRHTFVAGITALALLIAPVGFTAQWSDHGPTISTAPAISTAFAAPSRPTTKKPPASGAPTFTSSGGGGTARTEGWQTGQGKFSDDDCQAVADGHDAFVDLAIDAKNAGDPKWQSLMDSAVDALNAGMDQGCAFTGLPY